MTTLGSPSMLTEERNVDNENGGRRDIPYKLLRKVVRLGLERVRNGDFSTPPFDLKEITDILPNGDPIPSPKDKQHSFNRFLNAVATLMVEYSERNANKKVKEARVKEYSEQLHRHRNMWGDVIRWSYHYNVPNKLDMKYHVLPTNLTTTGENTEQSSPTTSAQYPDEFKNDFRTGPTNESVEEQLKLERSSNSEKLKRLRGRKRRASPASGPIVLSSTLTTATAESEKTPKRRKSESRQPAQTQTQPQSDVVTRHSNENRAKAEFEREKASVLALIPEDVRALFQQIGFAKWHKSFLPVLILSPYSVPAGAVRTRWFKMFNKVKQNKKFKNLSLLVHWYGTDDASCAYSLIPKKNFISYGEACKKGLDKMPQSLAKKVKSGRPLTANEHLLSSALVQIQVEIKVKPMQRKHLLTGFKEEYELYIENITGINNEDSHIPHVSDEDEHVNESQRN